MKKIFLGIFLVSALISKAQFPSTITSGNSSTLQKASGAFGGVLGYVFAGSYGDTTAANLSFIKNVPGIVIRNVDTLWQRNNLATEWLRIGGTGGTETDPTVDAIIKSIPVSADAATNKYLNWNGSAYVRKQIAYSEVSGTPDLSGYELLTNKSTTTTLGTSNTLYPTQNAVKTYVDNAVTGATPSLTQYRLAIGDASNLLSTGAAITGNRALISDPNGVPTHSTTTATELGYVSGVTSAIQTQINKNLDSLRKRYLNIRAINDTMWALQKWNGSAITEDTVVISLANGNKNEITVNNGWTDWTINNGVVTNAKLATGIDAAKIADGSVSNTEFQRLDGITSNVQTQLDGKQPNIQFKDEGTNTGTSGGITSVNFTGAGVTSSNSSGALTVNIPGGGGGTSGGTFKELRFGWGVDTNAPASGDSVLVHDSLIGKTIEVYREGELQDSSSQYIFDNTLGKITFRPAEFTGERNTIKIYPAGTRTSLVLETPATFTSTNRVAFYTNASMTRSGGAVTKWANADGNTAYDFNHYTFGVDPVDATTNGMQFTGAAENLQLTSGRLQLQSPLTIFLLVKKTGDGALLANTSNTNGYGIAMFSSGGVFIAPDPSTPTYYNSTGTGVANMSVFKVMCFTWAGPGNPFKMYIDGVLTGTFIENNTTSYTKFGIDYLAGFGSNNANLYLDGAAFFTEEFDATKVSTQSPLFKTAAE
jgi:hypothetical protein